MLRVSHKQINNTSNHNYAQCEYFRRSEDILYSSHPFHVVTVDDGENANGGGGHKTNGAEWGLTGAPERLEDVLGEGDGGDCVAGGYEDEEGDPEVEEGG